MIALNFIESHLPSLQTDDAVRYALDLMYDHKVEQLAVLQAGIYKGMISEAIIENATDNELIGNLALLDTDIFILQHQHLLEVLKFYAKDIQLLAVVDEKMCYKGVISPQKIIKPLAESYSIQRQGAILVLSLHERDYAISHISRIIEADNAKILSSYLETDNQKLLLTLKLDTENLAYVVASLERFGYDIVAKFQTDQANDFHKERLNNLLRFLEF